MKIGRGRLDDRFHPVKNRLPIGLNNQANRGEKKQQIHRHMTNRVVKNIENNLI